MASPNFVSKEHQHLPRYSIQITDNLLKGCTQEAVVLDKDGNAVGLLDGIKRARYEIQPNHIGTVVIELDGHATINSWPH